MKSIAKDLSLLLDQYLPALNGIGEEEFSEKPLPGKWSKKEMIGHLIDSAQNNLRRFIVARYEPAPLITYRQDDWVKINCYQQQPSAQLIQLWWLLNRQIVVVLENSPKEAGGLMCQAGELKPLAWLASDYIKHLMHHLHQVLSIEPVPYP